MDIVSSVAASRLVAQQHAMDVLADNIANASTPGFKAERMLFSDWREQQVGTLTHTGNPLDLAITGTGYFTVNTPRGPRLTRDGRFGLMPDGTVADSDGNAVLDSAGQPVKVSPTDTQLTIAGDGTLSSENGQLAKFGVVSVTNQMQLTAEGYTLFRADAPTAPVTSPGLVQGAMEDSNVQPVLETTRMIDNLRQFQFMSQFIQAESDRQQSAIDKLLPTQQS
jgi:flagellar basal-body rod protein FlgF